MEDFAGDLEYHPRRGTLYLAIGAAAVCGWMFGPFVERSGAVPLALGFGGAAVVVKALFLFRKSSEGLGLSQRELDQLSDPANRKVLQPMRALAGQMLQDFGMGPLVLGPMLRAFRESWNAPIVTVFLIGLAITGIGWALRWSAAADKSTML
jgi:hypothetical protein